MPNNRRPAPQRKPQARPAPAKPSRGTMHGTGPQPPVSAAAERLAPGYEAIWRFVRSVLVWLAGILMVGGLLIGGFNLGYSKLFAPVDSANPQPIRVEIARGSSVSSIGGQLVEADLVRNKGVFQYYAEFMGMSGKLKAGTYELRQDMTIHEIINALSMGDGGTQVMRFTLTEGMTIEEMAESLVNQRVLTSTRTFLQLCRSGESYAEDYDFIADVVELKQDERRYALEGYLFPDTYEIYVDASEDTIIRKMLNRTREIYNVNYYDRAEERKLTMDEVLTLASMVEKEAKRMDFSKVSAVFNNRITKNMALESCVTVQYALKIKRLALTGEDLAVKSPYNTYRSKGLPLGPVSNPGQDAIEAALYPDEEYVEEGYLFFCSKDPETGELQFSRTLKEHEAASEEYRPLWKAFDEKNNAN